jgi:hypothetical protein
MTQSVGTNKTSAQIGTDCEPVQMFRDRLARDFSAFAF